MVFAHATDRPEAYVPVAERSNLFHEYNRHFEVVRATTPQLMDLVHRVRFQVYCIDNAFENPAAFPDGRERDALDAQSLHSLLIHRETSNVIGTVRLVMPGQGELPARSLVPGAWPVPHATTGEVSRFSISKPARIALADDAAHLMPFVTLGLMNAIVAMTVEAGMTHWVAAMEPTLLRLLGRLGIRFVARGPVVEYHGRRQPCHAHVATLLDGIREVAPDAWDVITEAGRLSPEFGQPFDIAA